MKINEYGYKYKIVLRNYATQNKDILQEIEVDRLADFMGDFHEILQIDIFAHDKQIADIFNGYGSRSVSVRILTTGFSHSFPRPKLITLEWIKEIIQTTIHECANSTKIHLELLQKSVDII